MLACLHACVRMRAGGLGGSGAVLQARQLHRARSHADRPMRVDGSTHADARMHAVATRPQAAAMWLIDLDDVAAEEAAWRAALAEEREAAARSVVERKKSKAAILAR